MKGLEPSTFCMARAGERSRPFAPVGCAPLGDHPAATDAIPRRPVAPALRRAAPSARRPFPWRRRRHRVDQQLVTGPAKDEQYEKGATPNVGPAEALLAALRHERSRHRVADASGTFQDHASVLSREGGQSVPVLDAVRKTVESEHRRAMALAQTAVSADGAYPRRVSGGRHAKRQPDLKLPEARSAGPPPCSRPRRRLG